MTFEAGLRRLGRDAGVRHLLLWSMAWILMPWGCTSTVAVGAGGGNGDLGTDVDHLTPGGGQAGEGEVLIQFVNFSDADVDTQFYATNVALEDPPNDLIDPQFAVQTDVGVFGSGVLLTDDTGRFSVDEITFPCTDNTVLGTAGGEYLDPGLGTQLATGDKRVVQVGINFDCGNTIIFTFTGSEGDYSTAPPFVDFSD